MGILAFVFSFLFTAGQIAEFLVPTWFDPEVHTEKANAIEFEGITFSAENIEINENRFGFDIKVVNEAGHRVRLEEGNLFLMASDTPFPSDDNLVAVRAFESKLEKKFPMPGDQVAETYVADIERIKKRKVFLGLVSAGLIVFDIAMDIKGAKIPEWTRKNQFNTELRKILTMGGLTATEIAREKSNEQMYESADNLNYLDNEIFQFVDLANDSYMHGRVFFPFEKSKYIRIIFIVSDVEYALDFRWANYKDARKLRKEGYKVG